MDYTLPLNYSVALYPLAPVPTGAITWPNGWIFGLITIGLLLLSLAGIIVAALQSRAHSARPNPSQRPILIQSHLRVRTIFVRRAREPQVTFLRGRLAKTRSQEMHGDRHLGSFRNQSR